MSNEEMLSTFDVLYNNITSNQAPGLNIYEISLLLTRAQEELVKNYFNPKGNKYQEGYDESVKRHSDFAGLLCTKVLESTLIEGSGYSKLDYRSLVYLVPRDVFLLLNEQLVEQKIINVENPLSNTTSIEASEIGNIMTVVPLNYTEYTRLMQKPYKYPPKSQFWKLETGYNENLKSSIVEIIGRQKEDCIYHYHIRYVKHPEPIILMDLEQVAEGLTIDGKSKKSSCELSEHLHMEIVQRAVELAKAVWQGDLNTTLEIGQRSE